MNRKVLVIAAALAAASAHMSAHAGSLTFANLTHGAVITDDNDPAVPRYSGFDPTDFGVTKITATNVGGGPNIGVAFDTNKSSTRDPDLQFDPQNGWSGGNIAGTDLGFIAILQENSYYCGDGVCNKPDDEGSRPAGSLIFEFEDDLTEIGFDLIDVEGPNEYGNDSGYVAVFYDGSTELASVGFGEFIDDGSAFFQGYDFQYGNNYANRVDPITAAQLGISSFDKVEFNFGGSMGIDNLVWETVTVSAPEPGTLALLVAGLAFAGYRRRA